MRALMPRLAPSGLLAAAAALALLFCIAAYLVATHQPWLGVEFKPNLSPPGLLVVSVDPRSPNQQLKTGDVVTALVSMPGHEYGL